jgi:hypothetical protein
MTTRYENLTTPYESGRFYTVRSQLHYFLRHYRAADYATVAIEDNVRLGVNRATTSAASEAIVHICDFRVYGEAEYARFRLNDMRRGASTPLDLLDADLNAIDPNNVPAELTPIEQQNELGFMAIGFLRAEREAGRL